MGNRQIINIINFIRAMDPREECQYDLMEPVREQIKLIDQYNFSATFLIQYDALLMPEYQKMLKALDKDRYEIGVWFEIPQPLAEACGLTWTGRFPWDWHCHCGFSVGYSHDQKKKLLDELFRKFKEVFGYYPRSFGSWFFDSFTIRYAADTYGLDAVCNCKEQYGTDGYTLWGGYYGQGYYPSRHNVFMPAQTKDAQIDVPIFRMLGSDQVYQYDFGMDLENGAKAVQGVITLEPVYTVANGGGGGLPEWVDWYLKENYNGECLSFGYAQAGQENSFGWAAMKDGLTYQFARFDELVKQNAVEVVTLGDTGRWFKETYDRTPASTITAHSAFDDEEKKTVWYCSSQYRVNLYQDENGLRIRDLHFFAEDYADPYETVLCEANDATYDTLPAIDGNLNSGNSIRSGLYLTDAATGETLRLPEMIFSDLGNGKASLLFGGSADSTCRCSAPESCSMCEVMFLLEENALEIHCEKDFILQHRIGKKSGQLPAITNLTDRTLGLSYRDYAYQIMLESGIFEDALTIRSENGIVRASFGAR